MFLHFLQTCQTEARHWTWIPEANSWVFLIVSVHLCRLPLIPVRHCQISIHVRSRQWRAKILSFYIILSFAFISLTQFDIIYPHQEYSQDSVKVSMTRVKQYMPELMYYFWNERTSESWSGLSNAGFPPRTLLVYISWFVYILWHIWVRMISRPSKVADLENKVS